MSTATITSKGQITIPSEVRHLLKLQAGDKISFVTDQEGKVSFIPITQDVTLLKGIVKKPAKPVSIDAMNKVIKNRRGRL